jgi:gluconate 5-dehydrogenase
MIKLFDLSGKVALITGASRGLGFGMAEGLAQAGATVILNGRDPETLAEAARKLSDQGLKADVQAFDVTDLDAVKAGIDAAAARHGRLDILIANAGTHGAKPLPDWTPADWARVMDTNLTSCFFAAQAAAAHMIPHKSGRIIFMGSLTGLRGRPTIHGYAASKAGLGAIARTLANELGEHNITVNTIAGGYFETELSKLLRQNADLVARINARIPLRRWGKPEDLAGIAVFLASAAGSYITAQEICVDGGIGASL